jgi:hypothetical protein
MIKATDLMVIPPVVKLNSLAVSTKFILTSFLRVHPWFGFVREARNRQFIFSPIWNPSIQLCSPLEIAQLRQNGPEGPDAGESTVFFSDR